MLSAVVQQPTLGLLCKKFFGTQDIFLRQLAVKNADELFVLITHFDASANLLIHICSGAPDERSVTPKKMRGATEILGPQCLAYPRYMGVTPLPISSDGA